MNMKESTMVFTLATVFMTVGSSVVSHAQVPLSDGPGLYESGNSIPIDHMAAGIEAIVRAAPVGGTAALLCTGMSNARQEFGVSGQASQAVFSNKIEAISIPSFRAPGGCQDAMTSPVWAVPNHPIYGIANNIINGVGVQNSQVRAAFHKLVYANPGSAFGSVDEYVDELSYIGADVVRSIRVNFPYVEIVWFQARSYGGFDTGTLNPEPYAYGSGLAVRKLVQAQIDQRRTGIVDPDYGDLITNAPWIGWGPYFWAGETPRMDGLFYTRSDFMADGVHPTTSGVNKISDEMVEWCVGDPMCSVIALPEPGIGALVSTGLLATIVISQRRAWLGSSGTA